MTKISPWLTVTSFLLLWLSLWLPFAIFHALKHQWRPFQPSLAAQKLPLLIVLYLIAPLLLWGFCYFEGKTFATYGMPLRLSLISSMIQGLVGGSFGLALLFFMQYKAGWLQYAVTSPIQPFNLQVFLAKWREALPAILKMAAQLLLMLVLGIWIGWTEELIFRGFLQVQLEQDYSIWQAAAIGSLIFALLHGIWEGKAVVSQLPGLWLMGMVLVMARIADQNQLGLAWGLHAGWVWTLASLDALQLTHYTGKAPAWLTGLDGKPLAGAIGLLFLFGNVGYLWLLVRGF